MTSRDFLQKHDEIVRHLDEWFRAIQLKHAAQMQCGLGCTQCCQGLFDVSLPDAVRVAAAFGKLPEGIQSAVTSRSSAIQERIRLENPELREPFFLKAISHEMIDSIVDHIPDVRCPFLDDDKCLIYEERPIACRLEGVPMVDCQDGLFGDWCELNFQEGITPEQANTMKLDHHEIQTVEQEVAGHLLQRLPGSPREEATVFVPSVIACFHSFWKKYIATL